MEKILDDPRRNHILRLDQGEDAFKSIIKHCQENNIQSAWLSMIGAISEVELAYYHLPSQKYETKVFNDEDLEVLTVTGNLGTFANEPIIHAHGNFSKRDFSVIGGHINSMIVSATLEVNITILQGEINRELSKEIGLKLMCAL